jgi:phosphatidylinositol alpha-1,6-mannosyltransferase
VDLDLFRAEGPSRDREHDLQLVSVGRLIPRKNFHAVLDLLERLVSGGTDAGLWIAGSGPEKPALVRRGESMPGRVEFLENLSDRELAELYRSADLFASPCLSDPSGGDVEGFGLTFLEASACGLPVAGVAEGGVTDAVEHGVSGILTSRGEFVDRACRFATDRRQLARMGARGLRRAQELFDIRKVVMNLI